MQAIALGVVCNVVGVQVPKSIVVIQRCVEDPAKVLSRQERRRVGRDAVAKKKAKDRFGHSSQNRSASSFAFVVMTCINSPERKRSQERDLEREILREKS